MAIKQTQGIIQHPNAAPTLRCRPARVRGIPMLRDARAFAADTPSARFHENESPGIPLFRLPTTTPPYSDLNQFQGMASHPLDGHR